MILWFYCEAKTIANCSYYHNQVLPGYQSVMKATAAKANRQNLINKLDLQLQAFAARDNARL